MKHISPSSIGRRALCTLGIAMSLLASSASTLAFESDVHFGLTHWLALRAGFNEQQADAIAIANQRVDGGLVESTELDLEYACAGRFPDIARQAQRAHYPAAAAVPAPPADRSVQAGGAAARRALDEVFAAAKGKEGLMLGKFGHALHPLQDSWSHQGTPSHKPFGATLACDAALVSGHALVRGGPHSHGADLTPRWPADTVAMARATYDQLLAWGDVQGDKRKPEAWDALVPAINNFAKASTKTLKRAWFVSQGMPDTQFLQGISLPDGPAAGPLNWKGRMLPPLPGNASQQHDAPTDVRAFFDRVISRWLGAEKVEDVVADLGTRSGTTLRHGDAARRASRELIARLKLWKLRDHGAAADLTHAAAPLTEAQLKRVERMTRDASANVAPSSLADAVFSLQPSTPQPMPMLPYIVRPLPDAGGAQRTIAIARLKHAPYDTVGWIAEKRGNRWALTDMVASVDL